jgi:hypothetical protein
MFLFMMEVLGVILIEACYLIEYRNICQNNNDAETHQEAF